MSTQADTVNAISSSLNIAIEALIAARQAMPILQQSQTEGLTPNDPRWKEPFKALDEALAKAAARLT
jgi:hypothetical protein